MSNIFVRAGRTIRKFVGEHILHGRFPYAYAHFYYWFNLRKEVDYNNPKDFNQKLFWLARYWQDPRIVQCADKLAVRKYIEELGLGHILTKVYAVYDNVEQIDFSKLPNRFVLKCNHIGGGTNMVFCKDKSRLDEDAARKTIA